MLEWLLSLGHRGPITPTIVTGAVLDDGQQILVALPTDLPGVTIPPPPRLVGLSASHTGEVRLDGVRLPARLAAGRAGRERDADGHRRRHRRTANLDAGHRAGLPPRSIIWSTKRSARRDLAGPAAELRREHATLEETLLALASGQAVCSNDELRAAANSLALRTSQAALAAAKGTGYVVGPSGRPLVPRGAVLSGLELPARRDGRQSVRAGRAGLAGLFAAN